MQKNLFRRGKFLTWEIGDSYISPLICTHLYSALTFDCNRCIAAVNRARTVRAGCEQGASSWYLARNWVACSRTHAFALSRLPPVKLGLLGGFDKFVDELESLLSLLVLDEDDFRPHLAGLRFPRNRLFFGVKPVNRDSGCCACCGAVAPPSLEKRLFLFCRFLFSTSPILLTIKKRMFCVSPRWWKSIGNYYRHSY